MNGSLTSVLEGEFRRPTLAVRALAIAVLLDVEKGLLGKLMWRPDENQTIVWPDGIIAAERWTSNFLLAFAIALALFVYVRGDVGLAQVNRAARDTPLRPRWLLLHALCVAALVPLTVALSPGHNFQLPSAVLVGLWCSCGLGALLAAMGTVAPWFRWREVIGALGRLWIYALILALFGASAVKWCQGLWDPMARVTFDLVNLVLSPFVPSLHAYPDELVLATDNFSVEIAQRCSGLEGLGMMFALSGAWLVLFRKEYIFPRALILIPAGLLLIFALNILRIAGLVLIGHAGQPEVALLGFHSQAGWIAFNLAGCALVFVSRRSAWLNRSAARDSLAETENPTGPYLLPFIAILVAGMVAHATSKGFETLYALRLVAAAMVLAFYWRRLLALDWRFTWRGPAAGILAFGIWWLFAEHLLAPSRIPSELVAMPPIARTLWIVARASAAIITVPIAEELAYRGFLMRRLQSADFDSLRFADVGWSAILISALIFGFAHGNMWCAGIAAGILYGVVAKGTGRIGEAVVAHATTNAALAGLVLLNGSWQLW